MCQPLYKKPVLAVTI